MTRHDRFESAYRECFPVASSMQPDLFERDDDGYIEAKVHTAFTLWKAASATPEDHSVPVVIPEGWRLVPRTPTEGQEATGASHGGMTKNRARSAYMAMIDTAPQPPQKDADHIEAQSVPAAWRWREHNTDRWRFTRHSPDTLPRVPNLVEPLFAAPQAPQSDAQSIRDAALAEANKHIADLQKALFYWMPSIAGQPNPDGERAANDAYLLFGWAAGDEENCYGDRVRDAVIEECAKVCDELADAYDAYHEPARSRAAGRCGETVRALKSAPPQKPGSDEVKQ